MSVGPVQHLSARPAYAPGVRTDHPQFRERMAPVAQLFGMSSEQLMGALQRGQSLADIAQQHGVPREDLLAAVKQELGVQPASGSNRQLDTIANRIIHQKVPAATAQTAPAPQSSHDAAPPPRFTTSGPSARVDFRA
jgi:hypothetical protein